MPEAPGPLVAPYEALAPAWPEALAAPGRAEKPLLADAPVAPPGPVLRASFACWPFWKLQADDALLAWPGRALQEKPAAPLGACPAVEPGLAEVCCACAAPCLAEAFLAEAAVWLALLEEEEAAKER